MMQNAFNFTSPSEDQDVLRVLHAIRQRLGRDSAISMHELGGQLGISARQIQSIVKVLVEERHFPIGTSTRRPFGYYWITSDCERLECRNHLMRRALSTLRHAQAFDTDAIVAPLVGQLELTVEDER